MYVRVNLLVARVSFRSLAGCESYNLQELMVQCLLLDGAALSEFHCPDYSLTFLRRV